MKRSDDPRHQNRQKIVKLQPVIDAIITQCAPEWPLSQINRVDLAILRLGLYELKYTPKTPPKVVIDEAVELAKRYGSENSASFTNGVLGAALKKL